MRGIDLWQSSILRIVDSRNTVSNAAPAAKKWDFCIVWKKWWWEMEGYARAPTGFPSYRARTSPQKLTNCLRGLKNKIRSCIRYEQRCFWNDGIVSNLFHHCSRLYHCRVQHAPRRVRAWLTRTSRDLQNLRTSASYCTQGSFRNIRKGETNQRLSIILQQSV